jgi:moderate conductance mechanosensitive channel
LQPIHTFRGGNNLTHIFTSQFWSDLYTEAGVKAFHSILQILFILILFVIARLVMFRMISRAMAMVSTRQESVGRLSAASRARTLGGLLRSVTSYVLVFIAGFMILRAFGIDPIPVLTAASVVGLAVGFGAQKLVRDVISGFFILLENQYAVGDYVTIGAFSGTVEDVEMRTTRIRDDVGKLTIISNGDISIVTNHSRGPVLTSIEVGVAPGTDLDKACAVLRDLGESFSKEKAGVLGPFTCDGVAAMDGTKVTLRLVGRVEPCAQQDVQLDLRKRVRDVLAANGIGIA